MAPSPRQMLSGVSLKLVIAVALSIPAVVVGQSSSSSGNDEVPRAGNAQTPTRGFSLFANADFAGSGMRAAGNFQWAMSNVGPCAGGDPNLAVFAVNGCGGYGSGYSTFEVVLTAGVPLTDFLKIKAAHPDAAVHLGPQGYTELSTHRRLGLASQDWGPADGSIGRLFSGVKSTDDETCRDDFRREDAWYRPGQQLLATSDCPETWAPSGFDGPRRIPKAQFVALQAMQGNSFTFDWFRIPTALRGKRTLGDFSTYGEISDHFAEALASYGKVTPKGTGAPARNGFPLGLDVRFEAFSYERAELADAIYYQMIVINNSKNVYGVGIDYDSLYMGLSQGISLNGDDHVSQYAQPHRNAIFMVRSGVNIGCNQAVTLPIVSPSNCQNQGFRNTHGFGVVMLKSPIGDVRNKLLTRAGSFYNPASPYADDTITFNHHHQCGFGNNCFNSTTLVNDRRAFGMISSTEANVIDGRDPASITPGQEWATFRPKNFANPGILRFNRYVPGTWSYENKLPALAGQQDTLFLDTCAGAGFITVPNQNGGRPLPSCVVAFSDTTPGKAVNGGPGNYGGVMTAGPFRLKAGDTTSFVLSWFAARDSSTFEALADDVTRQYLNFFPAADAPPAPRIAGVKAVASRDLTRDARPKVELIIGDEIEAHVDPYFTGYANDVRTATYPSVVRLRTLNPGLADSVDRVAANNVAELLVYRSCDGGRTFDTRVTCTSNASRSAVPTPIARIPASASGALANIWVDSLVLPGVSYLYSLVPRSRGLTIGIVDVDTSDKSSTCAADATYAACRKVAKVLNFAPSVTADIATEGPSTARVYVPLTAPAGGRLANFVITRSGAGTTPVSIIAANNPIPGDYRVTFGNRAIVQQTINTASNTGTSTVKLQVIIPQATLSGVNQTNFVEKEFVFSGPGPIDVSGVTYTPAISTSGTTRVETDTITGSVFLFSSGNAPLFLKTDVLEGPSVPGSFIDHPGFPRFLFSMLRQPLPSESVVRPGGDTLSGVEADSGVSFLSGSTIAPYGDFIITFADDAFGNVPLSLSATPAAVSSTLNASLSARAVGTVGDTSARIRAILSSFVPGDAPLLRAVRFPFTVTSPQGAVILAARTRESRTATDPRMLLGFGDDTLRVGVDSLMWLPGDPITVFTVVDRDSVVAGRVVIDPATGRRILQKDTIISYSGLRIGCNQPRSQCNPLTSGPGATGYTPYEAGTRLFVNVPAPFVAGDVVNITVQGALPRAQLTKSSLKSITVTPNPYVVHSRYDLTGAPRLLFSGLPANGMIRIYSLAGQFIHQKAWTPGDLEGGTSGDLPWDLRTHSGALVASGLYIYVINAHDDRGRTITARGKFVIIR